MNKKLTINYRWRRAIDGGPVVEGHEKALVEAAEEHIREMDTQGYTSGELDAHVKMTAADPDGGIHYRGWWELTRADTAPPTELAEAHAALEYLSVLVLRNSGVVTSKEFFEHTKHLTSFRDLPEDVRSELVRIRKERFNLE